jgi:predicted regulator of Ras-like GTPase activity (Roadblock/LC7/MglB family)
MTIPFLDLFKKLTGRFGTTGTAAEADTRTQARVIHPKKPDAERLSKTVMPNATRSLSAPADPFRSAATTTATPRSAVPLELGARKITTSSSRPGVAAKLPPALARALEPKIERTISLRVADLIDAVPTGFIKPVEILDTNAVVLLKASEIEKGMPDKHPMISLPSLYQQVPEIFLRSVRPDDDMRVELPYAKVLEQFQSAQVRADQIREAAVPHVNTPILTATIQDSQRFGTKIEPIEASTLPEVPVKHATAHSIAEAEPEATPAELHAAVKLTASGQKVISLHSPELKPKGKTSAPLPVAGAESKIPFELSPNGTGASASERVPASSGPPVPTPLPFTPEGEKIPFKLSAEEPVAATRLTKPKVEEPVTPTSKPAVDKPATDSIKVPDELSVPKPPVGSPPAKDGPSISFSLKAVLKNLPAFQLNGDIGAVDDDAKIEFPLELVEPQLARGRVSVAPDVFQAAMPERYRELFQRDVAGTSVALPLEEVLKNLPATVLELREDQEEFALDKDFETPFLLKAREDAKRFIPKSEPTEKVSEQPAKEPVIEKKIDIESEAAGAEPVAEKEPGLEKVGPKDVVNQANALSGVKACAITFSDGLSLAGELPEEFEADGLLAMAPSMLERITQHVRETKFGELVAMTLYVKDSAISFFARGNVCLTALHETSLAPETRARLAELAEKLSQAYAQPE